MPKEKLVVGFLTILIEWLNQRPDSILVLLFMDAAIPAIGKSLPQVALTLLDNSIVAYFKSNSNPIRVSTTYLGCLNCEWSEVCGWVNIPTNNFKEYLFTTPGSESGVESRFLTLNAHLLSEMSRLGSIHEEEKLMKRLSDYLEGIKPK